MNYNKDEFLDLMQQVEDQGGEHLDEMCVAHKYNFTGKQSKPLTIAGCGNSSIFEVPYEPVGHDATLAKIKVCAVDDGMGWWPRFGGNRFTVRRYKEEDDPA